LIFDGRIKINQKVVDDPSYDVDEYKDKVFVDQNRIQIKSGYTVIVYNKPKGELVTSKDDRGRKTVYDSLPKSFRAFRPVGRLDFASEGLLILSDSIKVVDTLMNSSLDRVYNIKIKGPITNKMIQAMQEGVVITDATAGAHEKSKITSMSFEPFVAFEVLKNRKDYSRVKVNINEGKNRELRRFFAFFGAEVVDLKRVAYGGIELNNLPSGKYRFFSKKEYEELKQFIKESSVKKRDG
jgi:23S rRNA pseudouridine2605 synthase